MAGRPTVARTVEVNVRLAPGRSPAEVVDALRAAGLTVERELRTLGVVCGSAPDTGLGRLAEVDGVTAVERARGVSAL